MSSMKSLKEFLAASYDGFFLVKRQVVSANCCFGDWEPWYKLKRNLVLQYSVAMD